MNENIYLWSAYIGGIITFLSPCIFPILPVYLSILGKDGKKLLNTFLFILGLSITFILLGFSFGFIGQFLVNPTVKKISAIIVILLGLHQADLLSFNKLKETKTVEVKRQFKSSAVESFVLGLTFSLGWTPCVGPILATILSLTVDSASKGFGAILMAFFVLGFATPFLIFTVFYKYINNKLGFIKNNLETIKKISGYLIVILGILLFFDKFEAIVSYFNAISLGGVK